MGRNWGRHLLLSSIGHPRRRDSLSESLSEPLTVYGHALHGPCIRATIMVIGLGFDPYLLP